MIGGVNKVGQAEEDGRAARRVLSRNADGVHPNVRRNAKVK